VQDRAEYPAKVSGVKHNKKAIQTFDNQKFIDNNKKGEIFNIKI